MSSLTSECGEIVDCRKMYRSFAETGHHYCLRRCFFSVIAGVPHPGVLFIIYSLSCLFSSINVSIADAALPLHLTPPSEFIVTTTIRTANASKCYESFSGCREQCHIFILSLFLRLLRSSSYSVCASRPFTSIRSVAAVRYS